MRSMKKLKIQSLIVSLLALISGCAVVSENECRSGNWYERGVLDGTRGDRQDTLYKIAQECQKYGERVDSESWQRGYNRGLESFCTPENGFQLGRTGNIYKGACTGPTASLFVEQYELGRAIYDTEMAHSSLKRRFEKVSEKLQNMRRELRSGNLDKKQKRTLRNRRQKFMRELYEINLKIAKLGFEPLYIDDYR